MGRWDPGARQRLERAAFELFAEQGFPATTVPQIAERAGLTTRTFFRYFADKREVLFAGEDAVRAQFAQIVEAAPGGVSSMDLIEHLLEEAASRIFGSRFDELRTWRAIVGDDAGLRERELRKQQLMTDACVGLLRARGYDEHAAEMIARLAGLLLQMSITRWVTQPVEERRLVGYVRESIDQLRSIVGGSDREKR